MKAKVIRVDDSNFDPITIELTFENLNEVTALFGRLSLTQTFINKQYTTGNCQPIDAGKYTAPDYIAFDDLEDILEEIIDDQK